MRCDANGSAIVAIVGIVADIVGSGRGLSNQRTVWTAVHSILSLLTSYRANDLCHKHKSYIQYEN